MKRLCSILIFAVTIAGLASCSKSGGDDIEQLLEQLDRTIARRDVYVKAREQRIDSLKACYTNAATPDEKFHELGILLEDYRSFNSDSAMIICRRRQELAPLTSNPGDIMDAELNMADQLRFEGNFLEALEIVEPLNSTDVPEYIRPYFYHIKRTIYGLLYDSAIRQEDRRRFARLTDTYRDSLLLVNEPGSLVYQIIKCDQLTANGHNQEAIDTFSAYMEQPGVSPHDSAIAAFTLAAAYHNLGDRTNEKRQLIKSSIHDMESAVKEYLSLRYLAKMLYDEGDVERAYKYLKLCMSDASECNARARIVEINDLFPVVNDVYLKKIAHQQNRLRTTLLVVCLLLICLVVALLLVHKQKKRADMARKSERLLNERLIELNRQLKKSNEDLSEANRAIAENSYLKEEYIARYMDQCLVYIEKLDAYRRSLNKLVLTDRIDELKKQTKSMTFIDGELKNFYDSFDSTFLRLFPTFVEDFNKLLRPEEQILPRTEGSLNTELRIFALIRLGINDSVRIARFLRYSTTTIYNYRTRVRNKALGDRDLLEVELMNIGRDHGAEPHATR